MENDIELGTEPTSPEAVPQDEGKFIEKLTEEPDLAKRYGMFVNNPYKSDVQFVFETEKVILFGHKLVILSGSPVFNAMFNGDKWMEQDIVKIIDIRSAVFTEILNYIYSHNCNLRESNAVEIMSGAHKYQIVNLENFVCDFLISRLTIENVCTLYEASFLFENKLSAKCADMIKRQAELIFSTQAFLDLNVVTLKNILSFEQFFCEEYKLVIDMVKWAEFKFQGDDKCNSENIRERLKGAEKLIRFPTMSVDDFAKCSSELNSIFSNEEIGALFLSITQPATKNDALPYCNINRTSKIPEESFLWALNREGMLLGLGYDQETIGMRANYKVKLNALKLKNIGRKMKNVIVLRNDIMLCNINTIATKIVVNKIIDANVWHTIKIIYSARPNPSEIVLMFNKVVIFDDSDLKFNWKSSFTSTQCNN